MVRRAPPKMPSVNTKLPFEVQGQKINARPKINCVKLDVHFKIAYNIFQYHVTAFEFGKSKLIMSLHLILSRPIHHHIRLPQLKTTCVEQLPGLFFHSLNH